MAKLNLREIKQEVKFNLEKDIQDQTSMDKLNPCEIKRATSN